jgi:hypothetical protein
MRKTPAEANQCRDPAATFPRSNPATLRAASHAKSVDFMSALRIQHEEDASVSSHGFQKKAAGVRRIGCLEAVIGA